MKSRTLMLTLLAMLLCVGAKADTYYRVKNTSGGNYLTEVTTNKTVVCSELSTNNYAQLWKLTYSGSNVTFQNALSQNYIQTKAPRSGQYTTGATAKAFAQAGSGTSVTFTDQSSCGLHREATNNVVSWDVSEAKSNWSIEEVTDVDEAALAAIRTQMSSTVSKATLLQYFTTSAATEIKSGVSDFSALPEAVRTMATKIKNNTWGTMERQFRIADYKAYSSPSRWTSIIGMGHPFGRLTNPTGIYAEGGDLLQVYVGAIPSGQSVSLEVAGYGQASGARYPLTEGMNVVYLSSAGNVFVCYEVDNTNNGAKPYTALSTYNDVTVHIEGGTVQGYFDLTKDMTNADWSTMKSQLMTKEMFCMKSRTLVFNLKTDLLKTAVGDEGQVVELLNYWQSIQDLEDELMARGNEEYCNNMHSVTSVDGSGALYASSYGIYFSADQHNRLFNYARFHADNDNVWAAAHELGHHRQNLINMVGNTEISNNIFSNVAIWKQGIYTSRTASLQTTLNKWKNGISWPDRVADGSSNAECLHLNWQLYQFFHINEARSNFFPALFTVLKGDPMNHAVNTFIPASEDYLKYYETCCEVGGYDLTEFFEAYGFFILPTQDVTLSGVTRKGWHIEDYGEYYLYCTQDMIDQAKARVKAMNLPKANIIFIEDRVSNTAGRKLYPGTEVTAWGQVGETGQYTTFGATASDYTCNINSRGIVKMKGTGAVGFRVYDRDGNLALLANTNTFTLPEGLEEGYTIEVASGMQGGTKVTPTIKDGYALFTLNNTNVNRGALMYAPSQSTQWVWSSGKNAQTFSATDANCQWAMIPVTDTEDQFYLYNVGAKKFVVPTKNGSYNGYSWMFSDNAVALKMTTESTGEHKFYTANGTAIYLSVSNNYNGPIINYNDVGAQFTVTEVGDASDEVLQQMMAACDRLVENTIPVASASELTDGWYAIRIKTDAKYTNKYLYTMDNEVANSDRKYPLGFDNTSYVLQASTADPVFLTRLTKDGNKWQWQMPNGRYLVQGGNYFPVSAATAAQVEIGYNEGFYMMGSNKYATPFYLSNAYIIAETSASSTRYDFLPVSLSESGLTAWQVVIPTGSENMTMTCTRSDVHGLKTVYNNGYFFLPTDVTPTSADFEMNGMATCNINASDKTITSVMDASIALLKDNIIVKQGYQTTALGNKKAVLLRTTVSPIQNMTDAVLTVTLQGNTASAITGISLIETENTVEFNAVEESNYLSTIAGTLSGNTAIFELGSVAKGNHYYWIVAKVNTDESMIDEILDAAFAKISYACNNTNQTVELTESGNPSECGLRVMSVQSYPFLPTTYDSGVYRIPALTTTSTGRIIVAADKRYNSITDIGNGHVIDIVVRYSDDGGKTWSDPQTIAKGDNSNDATCGYGDPSLTIGKDGKIFCLFAAGNIGYFHGLKRICMSTSDDNGATWTAPVDLWETGRITDHASSYGTNTCYGLYDYFVTSGKGLYTNDGVLMYLLPGQPYTNETKTEYTSNSQDFVFYSTDDGATWHISENAAYIGGDEAKLEQLNDGSLVASVRQGNGRGFNFGTYTKNANGTVTFNWGTQYQNAQLHNGNNGNNQDILYYSRETEGKDDVLLHTMTTGAHANLKLYMSFDQGRNWIEATQIQPGGARYAVMTRLANGDLGIIFEDFSLGAGNQYPINFITMSKSQIEKIVNEQWETAFTPIVVNSVLGSNTGADTYGTYSDNNNGWDKTWTSKASSGVTGLTVSSTGYNFNKATVYGQRVFAMRPETNGATSTITITAPEGYVIESYTITGRNYSSSQTYTLTASDGTNVTTNTTGKTMTINDIYMPSTSFTFYGSNTTNYLCITNFSIKLCSRQRIEMTPVGDKSYATLYLPYSVTLSNVASAYKVSVDGQWAMPTEVGQDVAALTPVLLYSETGVPFVVATVNTSATTDNEGNALQGTLVKQHVDGYVLNSKDDKVGFFRLSEAGQLAANRAYLPASVTSNVKGLMLNWDGTTDGIATAEQFAGQNDANVYNLAGQRLQRPTKAGVYIVNGKKVVIK